MNNNQGRRRTRRARSQRKQSKTQISRILLTICMMALVAVVSIGGTIAWLTDSTNTVTNTFTPTDIKVDLEETIDGVEKSSKDSALTEDFQIIPGVTIAKDPKVTAESDVAYYVFVKVTEKNWPSFTDDEGNLKVSYSINTTEWSELESAADSTNGIKVYYKALTAGTKIEDVSVLTNDQVLVSSALTKEELRDITTDPTLTFEVYAIQQDGFDDVSAAWTEVSGN